jgi:hypothetical protein
MSIGSAQLLGPVVPSRTFEIGYIQKWFNRDTEDKRYDWGMYALYIKYGVYPSLTFTAESIIHDRPSKKFPDRDYRSYVFGVGITAGGLDFAGIGPVFSLHYNERLGFDRSEDRYHKNTRGIICAIQLERKFNIYDQDIRIWLGPAYVYDILFHYPGHVSMSSKSVNNFGFICGINILFIKHFDCFAHIVYANYFQPRYGIGFRF